LNGTRLASWNIYRWLYVTWLRVISTVSKIETLNSYTFPQVNNASLVFNRQTRDLLIVL